jgi:hypothetical protein
VRLWQQSNALIQGEPLYAGVKTAKMFWWFNQGAPVEWYATPKPHYGSDGSKQFGIIDKTGCRLERASARFRSPRSGGRGRAALERLDRPRVRPGPAARTSPTSRSVYLPHLDYDYQRVGPGDPKRVAEADACAGLVIDAAKEVGAKVVVVSEYGLVPVSRPVYLNRALRKMGWLAVRDGPYGKCSKTFDSRAFAWSITRSPISTSAACRPRSSGKDRRVARGRRPRGRAGRAGPRPSPSGELIALAKPDSWFAYPYLARRPPRARLRPHGRHPPQARLRSVRAVPDVAREGGDAAAPEESSASGTAWT